MCHSLNDEPAAGWSRLSTADELFRKNSSGAHRIQHSNPLAVENIAMIARTVHKPHRRFAPRFEQAIAIAPMMHAIGIRFATLMPHSHVSAHAGVKIRMLATMNGIIFPALSEPSALRYIRYTLKLTMQTHNQVTISSAMTFQCVPYATAR